MALRKLYNATPRKILDKNPTLTKFGKIFWAVVDGFNIIPGIFQSKSRGGGGRTGKSNKINEEINRKYAIFCKALTKNIFHLIPIVYKTNS